MRIAYGVMGYGRGHAMRTGTVLPALMAEHEITVFAGSDAYEVLAPQFPTVRIPTIGYAYNGRTGGSNLIPAIVFVAVPLFILFAILASVVWFIHRQGYF